MRSFRADAHTSEPFEAGTGTDPYYAGFVATDANATVPLRPDSVPANADLFQLVTENVAYNADTYINAKNAYEVLPVCARYVTVEEEKLGISPVQVWTLVLMSAFMFCMNDKLYALLDVMIVCATHYCFEHSYIGGTEASVIAPTLFSATVAGILPIFPCTVAYMMWCASSATYMVNREAYDLSLLYQMITFGQWCVVHCKSKAYL